MRDPGTRLFQRRGIRHTRRLERGFTLIEVLVTTAVTLVAFTGLATLQMLALRSADSALDRARAAELAYEMIDRMRLNRGDSLVDTSALGGGYDNITLCDANNRNADDSRACTHESTANLAGLDNVDTDLREWWQAIDSAELPHWYAGIQRNNEIFLVAVQWDDTRAMGDPQAAPAHGSCLGPDMPGTMEEICIMTQL